MKRKIATLEVWIDETEGAKSALQARMSSDEFRLIIAPNEDEQSKGPGNLPSIIAHELGHFMAHLLKDKAHTRLNRLAPIVNFRKMVGDWSNQLEKRFTREVELPTEVQAWKYADMIYPNVKQEIRAAALYTYEGYGGTDNMY
jgi:hypothetical protein